MASQHKQTMWMGHPILDPKHVHDLELAAAVGEFHHGMPRQDAEKLALDDYRKEHHARAAAHHLNGLKAANATGAREDGEKHYALYRLHVKALGHEPHGAVPPEVKRYQEGEGAEPAYRFKGHGADSFLVQSIQGPKPSTPAPQPVQKSEEPILAWLYDYLLDLAKADVVDLHGEREHKCPHCGFHDTVYRATRPKNRDHDRECTRCRRSFNANAVPRPDGPPAPRAPDGSRSHLHLVKGDVVPFPAVERRPTTDGAVAAPVQRIERPAGYGRAMLSDDYTHMLPEDVRGAGYTAFLDHHGYDMATAKDGFATARLMLGGQQVGSQWHYPGIDPKPGEGKPLAGYPGHQHEKAVVHLPVILGEHAKLYRQAWHKANDPAIEAHHDAKRDDAVGELLDRTDFGKKSLLQAFRARNQQMQQPVSEPTQKSEGQPPATPAWRKKHQDLAHTVACSRCGAAAGVPCAQDEKDRAAGRGYHPRRYLDAQMRQAKFAADQRPSVTGASIHQTLTRRKR